MSPGWLVSVAFRVPFGSAPPRGFWRMAWLAHELREPLPGLTSWERTRGMT